MKTREVRRLGRREAASTAIIWIERLWSMTWPATGVIAVFLAVALLDLLPSLPGWLHAIVLVAFFVALAVSIVRQVTTLRAPARPDGRRRLEVVNDLSHRPLTVLNDALAAGGDDPGAAALWRRHQARVAAQLARLRIGHPRSLLPLRDPTAFRLAVMLVLIVGLVSGGGDAGARLLRAVEPQFGAPVASQPISAEMQVIPPEYTNVPPIFFDGQDAAGAAIGVPSGSRVLAQVHNSQEQPSLIAGAHEENLQQFAGQTWRGETLVEADETTQSELSVELSGDQLVRLPIVVVPDEPPLVTFATPPAATPRAALRLQFTVADDYGVERVQAGVTRPGATANDAGRDIELNLPLSGRAPIEDSGTSFHDLTAHPWAGLPVEIHLSAVDNAGLVGTSDPVTVVLPERNFEHPIARAIIDERRSLTLEPQNRDQIAENLGSIAEAHDHYRNDVVVQLALNIAKSRLHHDRSDAALEDVLSMLWDTALRVEDGGLTLAERELRELQRRLQEALAGDASDEELERLLDELQAALDRFFEAAQEQLRNQLEQGQLQPQQLDPDALAVGQEDLQRMIEQMRELNRLGARDAAQQMLSQLQEMLENLQSGMMAMQQQGPSPGQELMQDLQDVIRGQQELLDETFRQSQEGSEPSDSGEADAATQEQLRRELGEVMRRLGEMSDIPGQLGRAEQAMRESTESLSEGQPGQALGPQQEALDQLQQGAQAAARALAQQQPGGPGQFGQMPGQFGNVNPNNDPLGRPLDGANGLDTGRVQIPDEADVQRARQILDELRRRSGDSQRPVIERDYIDRLLRRF